MKRQSKAMPKTTKKPSSMTGKQRKAKIGKNKGIFITFEGGEGVGKTTQIARLAHVFEKNGRRVVLTREPGGSQTANRIRSLLLDTKMKGLVPLAELFLYEASRAQHMADVVQPELDSGSVVICDRFTDSSVVYQGVARGLDGRLVAQLNKLATNNLVPDITILLDLDPRIGLARIGARGVLDRLEKEHFTFHLAVRNGFLALAKKEKKRFVVVDASQSRDSIHEQIITKLDGILS